MKKHPIILVFNRHYLPGYRAGGPIRTLVNMVSRLGADFEFRIVTLDRDIGESKPYENVARDQWCNVDNAKVLYLSQDRVSVGRIRQIVNDVEPDVIYLNSFFDKIFTQRVLWARRLHGLCGIPIVLAPRGEFSTGALSVKSLKKRAYLFVDRYVGLYKNIVWQASSEYERNDILNGMNYVLKDQVCIAVNIAPDLVVFDETYIGALRRHEECECLNICFLSRISPMKNLDYAINVLASVSSRVKFTIYGPNEDKSYWYECERLIDSLPENICVIYEGEVQPQDVRQKLSQHDLFFLPTRGENYGHVIFEALSAGLPVLISDQTPWTDLGDNEVGWAFPLNSMESFVETIEKMSQWSSDQHEAVSRRARKYAFEKTLDDETLIANRRLFLDVIKCPSPLAQK